MKIDVGINWQQILNMLENEESKMIRCILRYAHSACIIYGTNLSTFNFNGGHKNCITITLHYIISKYVHLKNIMYFFYLIDNNLEATEVECKVQAFANNGMLCNAAPSLANFNSLSLFCAGAF